MYTHTHTHTHTHSHTHTHAITDIKYTHTYIIVSTANAASPKSVKSRKFRLLGISRYKFKFRLWFHLNLYGAIWVSRSGGFRGCSICSGKCQIHTVTTDHNSQAQSTHCPNLFKSKIYTPVPKAPQNYRSLLQKISIKETIFCKRDL